MKCKLLGVLFLTLCLTSLTSAQEPVKLETEELNTSEFKGQLHTANSEHLISIECSSSESIEATGDGEYLFHLYSFEGQLEESINSGVSCTERISEVKATESKVFFLRYYQENNNDRSQLDVLDLETSERNRIQKWSGRTNGFEARQNLDIQKQRYLIRSNYLILSEGREIAEIDDNIQLRDSNETFYNYLNSGSAYTPKFVGEYIVMNRFKQRYENDPASCLAVSLVDGSVTGLTKNCMTGYGDELILRGGILYDLETGETEELENFKGRCVEEMTSTGTWGNRQEGLCYHDLQRNINLERPELERWDRERSAIVEDKFFAADYDGAKLVRPEYKDTDLYCKSVSSYVTSENRTGHIPSDVNCSTTDTYSCNCSIGHHNYTREVSFSLLNTDNESLYDFIEGEYRSLKREYPYAGNENQEQSDTTQETQDSDIGDVLGGILVLAIIGGAIWWSRKNKSDVDTSSQDYSPSTSSSTSSSTAAVENTTTSVPTKEPQKTTLESIDEYEFEQLIADLWEKQGWDAHQTTGSNDRGIDVIAEKQDPYKKRVLIQAKKYSDGNNVGSPEVQQYASLRQQEDNVDEVIIVTTSDFTRQAKSVAKDLNVKLVDGEALETLLEKFNLLNQTRFNDRATTSETTTQKKDKAEFPDGSEVEEMKNKLNKKTAEASSIQEHLNALDSIVDEGTEFLEKKAEEIEEAGESLPDTLKEEMEDTFDSLEEALEISIIGSVHSSILKSLKSTFENTSNHKGNKIPEDEKKAFNDFYSQVQEINDSEGEYIDFETYDSLRKEIEKMDEDDTISGFKRVIDQVESKVRYDEKKNRIESCREKINEARESVLE